MTPDSELLTRYATERDEAAFAELVQRHVDHVYCTALRLVGGDAHLAEDVAQTVFTELARKAGSLSDHPVLSGWLHSTARFVAAKVVRSEQRRRQREQTALTMPAHSSSEPDWDQVRAFLDDSIGELDEVDRDVLMLRYFEKKPLIEVGLVFGISEDAARMRVGRAVDKLRSRLAARGIISTAAALGAVLAANLAGTAPAALGSRIIARAFTAAATGGSAGSSGIWPILTGKAAVGAGIALFIAVLGLWSHSISKRPPDAAANATAAVPVETPSSLRAQRAARSSLTPLARERPVKMLFQVIGAAKGAGVPNATVHAVFFGPGGSGEPQDIMTDDTGTARIREPVDPTKTSGPNVFVTAEGYVPKVIGLHGNLPATYTMKLDPGRSAAGRVINEDGKPVAGVKLGVQTRSGDYKSGAENIDFQTIKIVSDENGGWRCSCIPSDYDEVRFILTHDDYAVTLPVVPVNQVNLTNLVFVIDRGFTVIGQVTGLSGLPVADAEVRELCTTSYRRQKVQTDASGAFVLKGVSGYESSMGRSPEQTASGACLIRGLRGTGKASIKLAVQAEGFAPEIKTVALDSPTTEVQFGLSAGHVFWGRLVDQNGEPVPNAVVQTDTGSQGFWTYWWRGQTDGMGYFEWRSAPAEPVLYWFEAPGYETRRDVSLLADGSEHEIRLRRLVP